MAAENQKDSCYPVTLEWSSIQLLVNSEIFKLLLNLFLMHLRAQSACYELKGDLSPVMLKEIFHNKDLYEYNSRVTWWQKLFFSYKSF